MIAHAVTVLAGPSDVPPAASVSAAGGRRILPPTPVGGVVEGRGVQVGEGMDVVAVAVGAIGVDVRVAVGGTGVKVAVDVAVGGMGVAVFVGVGVRVLVGVGVFVGVAV